WQAFRVQADEVRAATPEVRQVRRKRRADRHLVDVDDEEGRRTRDGGDLQPLLVELRLEHAGMLAKHCGERPAHVEAGRNAADAEVDRSSAAEIGELAEAAQDVFGEHAARTVSEPRTNR